MEILKPKVEVSGIMDLLGIGIAKSITETMLSPYIGNATIKSGIVKLIAGGVIYGKAGRIGNILSGGLLVDASEDIVKAIIMPMISGSGIGGGNSNAPNPYGL